MYFHLIITTIAITLIAHSDAVGEDKKKCSCGLTGVQNVGDFDKVFECDNGECEGYSCIKIESVDEDGTYDPIVSETCNLKDDFVADVAERLSEGDLKEHLDNLGVKSEDVTKFKSGSITVYRDENAVISIEDLKAALGMGSGSAITYGSVVLTMLGTSLAILFHNP